MSVRIKLLSGGVRALLSSEAMEAVTALYAAEAVKRAGEGYAAAEPHRTGQRVAVNVYPATREAAADNLESNTLLKSIGGRMS